MKRYQVNVNGKQYVVEVQEFADNGQLSVPESRIGTQPTAPTAQGAPKKASADQGVAEGVEVKAPLTGQVLRVLVKPGDEVTRGQVLLTIEALKLENEIVSPVAGVVTGVFAQEGTVANTGAVLVTVKG